YAWPQIEFNEAAAQAFAQCLEHLLELDRKVAVLQTQLHDLRKLRRAIQPGDNPTEKPAPRPEESCAIDYYFKFEERFRGSRALIRERQQLYADRFKGRGAVLDIGCGRGEFLELLGERGIAGYGVDLNAEMVAESCALGFHAVRQDARE